MARTKQYFANRVAEQWLRRQAGVVLTADVVPLHLSRSLFLPDGPIYSRYYFTRLVMVLDLWRTYYKALDGRQVLAYQIATAIELGSTNLPAEWRYLSKCCVEASEARLRELIQEMTLTGQVLIPKKEQPAGTELPHPAPVARALKATTDITNALLRPTPDILP